MGLKRQMPILYAAPCLATLNPPTAYTIALYPFTAAQLRNYSSHAARGRNRAFVALLPACA